MIYQIDNIKQAKELLKTVVELYNNERPHMSIGNLTPNQVHQNNIKTEKFNGLDHLRALAILLVFFFHYFILSDGEPKWLPDYARFGWTGVDLFFVLIVISFAEIVMGGVVSVTNPSVIV